jgi:hypothetical protein
MIATLRHPNPAYYAPFRDKAVEAVFLFDKSVPTGQQASALLHLFGMLRPLVLVIRASGAVITVLVGSEGRRRFSTLPRRSEGCSDVCRCWWLGDGQG